MISNSIKSCGIIATILLVGCGLNFLQEHRIFVTQVTQDEIIEVRIKVDRQSIKLHQNHVLTTSGGRSIMFFGADGDAKRILGAENVQLDLIQVTRIESVSKMAHKHEELVKVLDDGAILLDMSICKNHNRQMRRSLLEFRDGERYAKKRLADMQRMFPNSGFEFPISYPVERTCWFCDECHNGADISMKRDQSFKAN